MTPAPQFSQAKWKRISLNYGNKNNIVGKHSALWSERYGSYRAVLCKPGLTARTMLPRTMTEFLRRLFILGQTSALLHCRPFCQLFTDFWVVILKGIDKKPLAGKSVGLNPNILNRAIDSSTITIYSRIVAFCKIILVIIS